MIAYWYAYFYIIVRLYYDHILIVVKSYNEDETLTFFEVYHIEFIIKQQTELCIIVCRKMQKNFTSLFYDL